MSFVVYTKELTETTDHVVDHNLNTTNLLVTVWQNGHSINPSVLILNENSVAVYGIIGDARIVIGGIRTAPQGKREVKQHGEEEQGGDGATGAASKPAKPARSKGQGAKRSAKGSSQGNKS